MLREEAIEYIHKLFMQAEITDEYGDMDDTEPYETAIDMAVEALKFRGAYEIAVKEANKAFENGWTQWVEWIPCSERLPNEEEKVLVTDDDGTIYIAYYTTICDEPYWTWAGWSLHPKAWMQLPTPYIDTTPSEEGGTK